MEQPERGFTASLGITTGAAPSYALRYIGPIGFSWKDPRWPKYFGLALMCMIS